MYVHLHMFSRICTNICPVKSCELLRVYFPLASISAIITRTFLQTTRKPLSFKTVISIRIQRVCITGAHLTPASQNIIHPRQFHNAALLLPLRQSSHVLDGGEKDREGGPP